MISAVLATKSGSWSAIVAPAGAMPLNTTRPNARGLRRDAFQERLALISLAAPALLIVVVTILVPVGWLFWLSFTADDGSLSLEHYRRMLEHPSYARTFRITFEVEPLTTAICIAARLSAGLRPVAACRGGSPTSA